MFFFGFGGRDASDGFEQAAGIEPAGPFERRVVDGLETAPRAAAVNDLRLQQAVASLRESFTVAVSDASGRWLDTGLAKTLGILDGQVSRPAIRVEDQSHGQALRGELTHDVERAELPSTVRPAFDEILGPDVV